MIEAGLFELLTTTAAMAALCGTRIYPMVLPELPILPGAPSLTYQIIAATPRSTLNTSGFQRWRVQFDAFGQSYGDAANLRKTLIETLNGYQGVLNDGTNLQNADFIQATDYFDQDTRTYRCMVEFYLYFNFQN